MACGSKDRTTPAHTETNCSHGEVEAVCREAIVHKIVNVPQQANRTRLAFELMERFGVNAVGHERRTNAMTRHVAQQDGQYFIAVWERQSHRRWYARDCSSFRPKHRSKPGSVARATAGHVRQERVQPPLPCGAVPGARWTGEASPQCVSAR